MDAAAGHERERRPFRCRKNDEAVVQPARWARVAALSDAEYPAAYDEYMAAKTQADAIADEARRREIRGRRVRIAQPASREALGDFRFRVSSDSTAVVAMADGAIRFPERERGKLRDELRTALAALDVHDGQVLCGTFIGPLLPGSKTDVENRVLLNISPPERCLRHGFAFEHDRDPTEGWACGYRYRAVKAEDPFELWRPGSLLAGWRNVPLAHGLIAPAIWWALRTARGRGAAGPAIAVPATLLRATVTSPRSLSLNQIKAIADGAVAAAQWTRIVDPGGLHRLTTNLTRAGISAERAAVSELLQDAAGAGR